MYKLKGSIKEIGQAVQVSEAFKKRNFVVIDDSAQYAQTVEFQLNQDKCDLVDVFKVGDKLEVNFVVNGREWTNPKTNEVRYFNTLVALSLVRVGESSNHAPSPDSSAGSFGEDGDDDLPF